MHLRTNLCFQIVQHVVVAQNLCSVDSFTQVHIEAANFFPAVAILWILLLCVCSVQYCALNCPHASAHHIIIQLCVNVVILATTILATILWVR